MEAEKEIKQQLDTIESMLKALIKAEQNIYMNSFIAKTLAKEILSKQTASFMAEAKEKEGYKAAKDEINKVKERFRNRKTANPKTLLAAMVNDLEDLVIMIADQSRSNIESVNATKAVLERSAYELMNISAVNKIIDTSSEKAVQLYDKIIDNAKSMKNYDD